MATNKNWIELSQGTTYNPKTRKHELCLFMDGKMPVLIEEYAKGGKVLYDISACQHDGTSPDTFTYVPFATVAMMHWGIKEKEMSPTLYNKIAIKCKGFIAKVGQEVANAQENQQIQA